MKLAAPFIRLPHRFDAAVIGAEIEALDAAAWQDHPRRLDGHLVAALISADGQPDLTRLEGAMQPAETLSRLPALSRVLAALDTIIGRAMLVRVSAGHAGPLTVDLGPYWHRRGRLIIAVGGGSGAHWNCAELQTPVDDGQIWLIDGWRGYRWTAGPEDDLVFVMVDVIGSAAFWSTVRSADRPLDPAESAGMSPRQINLESAHRELETETVHAARVMSPWEMDSLVKDVMDDVRAAAPDNAPHLPKLEAAIEQYVNQWQGIYARHGEDEAGDAAYRQAMEQLVSQAGMFAGQWKLANGVDAAQALYQTIVAGALRDGDGQPVVVLPPNLRQQARHQAGGSAAVQPAQQEAHENRAPAPGAPARAPASSPATDGASQAAADPASSPLRSVHTASLPQLLKQTGSSVLVSTYQAGKLAVLRANNDKLNTHFRVYNRPMGLAHSGGRLALGTASTVEFYYNMAAVAPKLKPENMHDAAFMPRRAHVTGNIDIHEMAYAGDELWLVNTKFSCLCTLDEHHSFVPRWRPKFISGYAAEDRCHLNGLEVVDGRPKYVTALGTADTAGGWRENKAGGGVLMDVESNEIICRGLSMPHSPRWYQGKLWVLESGNGTLATVDPDNGQLEVVAELPGFTRGLSFLGPYAFVGLSQVRESAVFSGISLTERVSERSCGVWVVDIRSGKTVAYLKFEDAVQEVFAVQVLPGMRFPDVLAGNDPQAANSFSLPDEALKDVVQS